MTCIDTNPKTLMVKRSTNFDSVAVKHVIGPLFIEILGHVHSQGALGIVLARPGGDGVGRLAGGMGAGIGHPPISGGDPSRAGKGARGRGVGLLAEAQPGRAFHSSAERRQRKICASDSCCTITGKFRGKLACAAG